MRKVTIARTETGDDGTRGLLKTDSGFSVYTQELPWRDNHSDRSCILPGPTDAPVTYRCEIANSPEHGLVYYVRNVKSRTNVEIHPFNLAGDILKGLCAQALGCIGLGRSIDTFKKGDRLKGVLIEGGIGSVVLAQDQQGVTSSKDAVEGFMADLDGEPFDLTISWKVGG